ncbi:hypothetical protein V2W45_248353 [Cenococcum geophilum]
MAMFYVGIAMIIIYGFSVFSNIIIGALLWRDELLSYSWRSTTIDRGCLKKMFTLPFSFLWAVLVGIFLCLFLCLLKRMQRPIRFSI